MRSEILLCDTQKATGGETSASLSVVAGKLGIGNG